MMETNNLCAQIYIDYRDKVFLYITNKVANPQDAEDLLSLVFLKIQENISGYDAAKASISTWVYTITHNIVCNYYRERTRHIKISYYDEIDYIAVNNEKLDEKLTNEETLEELATALDNIDEKQRDLIVLHYYNGLSLKKIAELMGITYSNAKYIHRKAIASLRKYFIY